MGQLRDLASMLPIAAQWAARGFSARQAVFGLLSVAAVSQGVYAGDGGSQASSLKPLAVCGSPTGLPLSFHAGDYGTVPQRLTNFRLTASGGTPPYTFSLAAGASNIPGLEISSYPDTPQGYSAGTGTVQGVPPSGVATDTPFTTQIQLTDCAGASVTKALTVRFSALDFNFQYIPMEVSELQTFSLAFSGLGGTGPYQIVLASGSLPAGVTFDEATKTLGGTPAAGSAGVYSFVLKITDVTGKTYTSYYYMNVVPLLLTIPAFPDRHIVGVANQHLSVALAASGGVAPYTFTLSPGWELPPGLSLSADGVLSGVPTYSFYDWTSRIIVTDSAATPNSYGFVIATSAPPNSNPSSLGASSTNLSDNTRDSFRAWGFYVYGGLPPYTCSLSAGSSLPEGVQILNWGAEDTGADPAECYLVGTAFSPGNYPFSLHIVDSEKNAADVPVSWHVSPMSLWDAYLPYGNTSATLNEPYSQPMMPAGGVLPYTITPTYPLPVGLSIPLHDQYGTVLGTPLETGSLPLDVVVKDSTGSTYTSNTYISIAAGTPQTLNISSGSLGQVQTNTATVLGLYVYGSSFSPPFTVSLLPDPTGPHPGSAALPPGLEVLPAKDFEVYYDDEYYYPAAVIAGVATAEGNYSYLLNIKDSRGNVGQRKIYFSVSSVTLTNDYYSNYLTGYVGSGYSQNVQAYGGTGSYTYSVSGGSLPPGLTLNASTGAITGTPTTAGQYSFDITATDSAGFSATAYYSIDTYSLRIQGPSILPLAKEGQPYSYTFTETPVSANVQWTTNDASWFSLDPKTGTLSGTPTYGGGMEDPQISVSNGVTSSVRTFGLPEESLEFANLLFGDGGGNYGTYLVNSPFLSEVYAYGGVPPYTATLAAGSALPPGLKLSNITDADYPTNGQDAYWIGYPLLSGALTKAGQYSFTFNVADAAGNSVPETISLTVNNGAGAAPVLLNSSLPNATYGAPYSVQLHAAGNGPFTFSVAPNLYNYSFYSLPNGLSLSPSGIISGTPLETGEGYFDPRVTICDSRNNCSTSYLSLQVYAVGPAIEAYENNESAIYAAAVGHNTQLIFNASDSAAVTWSIQSGELPPGLAFYSGASLSTFIPYAAGAVIAGAPTSAGSYTFYVRADDTTGNFAVLAIQIVVSKVFVGPQNTWSDETVVPPGGQVGAPYSFTFTGVNGTPPYTFSLASNGYNYLLPGMSLSSAGVLSGTPTEQGETYFTLQVTDSVGNVYEQGVYLYVYPGAKTIGLLPPGFSNLPSATVDTPYSFPLTNLMSPGYGASPINFALQAGTLPAGLSIAPANGAAPAAIVGTPTVATASPAYFDLLATDANGNQAIVYALQLGVATIGVARASGALPAATLGTPYSQTFTPFGGVAPYKFGLAYSSDLPVGMALAANGVLSGTPTSRGTFVIQITAADSTGSTLFQQYTLVVSPAGLAPPALNVLPDSISLTYVLGGPTPAPLPISIGSSAGALSFSAQTSGESWLAVSSSGAATPGTTTVSFKPAGLAVGSYAGSVTITSAAASNSPVVIPVALNVSAAASCSFTVPADITVPAAGGPVSIAVTTAAGCNWAASGLTAPWLAINGGAAGSGSGSVSLTAAPNSGAGSQTTSFTLAGQSVTVTEFGTGCGFSIQPNGTLQVTAAGGSGPVAVSASAGSCAWSAASPAGWISFGAPSSPGSGPVLMTVAANAGAARSSNVTIAGKVLTVSQAAAGCAYSLNPNSAAVSSSGGPVSVKLTTGASCGWNASTADTWISTPASGVGPTNINIAVAANSSTQGLKGSALIGGQVFTVVQAGIPCSVTLSGDNPVQPAAGGLLSVNVSTTGAGCDWTAGSNANWIVAGGAASGSGNGSVSFNIAANGGADGRAGSVTVAGQSLVVTQSGTVCTYLPQSPSSSFPAAGGSALLGVLTAPGCSWTASSAASWIHLGSNVTFNGQNELSFSVDSNPSDTQSRAGTITIAGSPYDVLQEANSCAIKLDSAGYTAGAAGGVSNFTYTTPSASCVPAVVSYSTWATVVGTSQTGTTGTVVFNVGGNSYSVGRSSTINVNGQQFSVSQKGNTCGYFLPPSPATFPAAGGSASLAILASGGACPEPAISIFNEPAGMLTLGGESGTAPNFLEPLSVSPYDSFLSYIRTAELTISGQPLKIKQQSY